MDINDARQLSVINRLNVAKLLRVLDSNPGIYTTQLTRELDITRTRVKRIVDDLVSMDLVTIKRDGPRHRIFSTGNVEALVERSKGWYKEYHSFLISILKSERMKYETDLTRDGDLEINFYSGDVSGRFVIPRNLTFWTE